MHVSAFQASSSALCRRCRLPLPRGDDACASLSEWNSKVVNWRPAQVLLVVIPTPFVARTLAPLAGLLQPRHIIVSCTKGILNDTLETPNEVHTPPPLPPLLTHHPLALE